MPNKYLPDLQDPNYPITNPPQPDVSVTTKEGQKIQLPTPPVPTRRSR